ncbi:MAG: methyltransferase type 12 [Rhodocyclaceae bacterium]|jgi:SAM-dependent methyltransferase|nr:methyltransferase type 12 [Rhodocyclaceae bacterium]
MPPLLIQPGILLGALLAALYSATDISDALAIENSPFLIAVIQGVIAFLAATLLSQPPWWRAIHLIFLPLVAGALQLDLPPWLYLAAFGLLVSVYWRTFRGDVPLYLSNQATAEAARALLPKRGGVRAIDLGAGTGGLLRHLASGRPDGLFTGIEHAPLPFLLARLAASDLSNCTVMRGDFWHHPLGPYDMVYAFLSPLPMPRLWEKAKAEMRPGSLLVSNSFPVPDVEPQRVIEIADRRGTRLYCYSM